MEMEFFGAFFAKIFNNLGSFKVVGNTPLDCSRYDFRRFLLHVKFLNKARKLIRKSNKQVLFFSETFLLSGLRPKHCVKQVQIRKYLNVRRRGISHF